MAPPLALLRITVRRSCGSNVYRTICRALIHIHFGLAHGISHGLNPLFRLFTNHHFLGFAGALFDHWLLVPFRHLEYALLHGGGAARDLTGCRAPLHDDALVPKRYRLFNRTFHDISANTVTPFGCAL